MHVAPDPHKSLTRMFILIFDGGRNGDREMKPLLKIIQQWMAMWLQ